VRGIKGRSVSAFEDPLESGEFLVDFGFVVGVVGDDGAEVTTEHAFGGDEGIEGLGWGLVMEAVDDGGIVERGFIVEDGLQDASFEDLPDIESIEKDEFIAHIEEGAGDDGLGPNDIPRGGGVVVMNRLLAGWDGVECEQRFWGGTFLGTAMADFADGEIVNGAAEERAEGPFVGVCQAEDSVSEDPLFDEAMVDVVQFVFG
jgi:hypothetical protein